MPEQDDPVKDKRTKEEAEEWVKSFREWVANLEPRTPHLPDETLRRENMYDDRGIIINESDNK